jgi:small nuclear ribonucleoprotein (snRNP)-like protein
LYRLICSTSKQRDHSSLIHSAGSNRSSHGDQSTKDYDPVQCLIRCNANDQENWQALRKEDANDRVFYVAHPLPCRPINLIFRYLQSKQTIQIWLVDQSDLRIEGRIIGFDEYMNLVLDDAHEVSFKVAACCVSG